MNVELDTYESALLAELRTHVDTRAPRRRPLGRWATGLAVAAAAGTAFVVTGLGGETTTAPAYAVEVEDDGDVIITINRLEDSAGLQADLIAAGIDATVLYDADPQITTYLLPGIPLKSGDKHYGAGGCQGPDPATITRRGVGWVVVVPADSPLHDGPVGLATSVNESMTIGYLGGNGMICLEASEA